MSFYEPGKILRHKLGFKVCVIKETVHTRGKGAKQKIVKMIKCRFMDKHGILHVHEFFPYELLLNLN